ncbi:unnamed protein product [Brassica oleracea]
MQNLIAKSQNLCSSYGASRVLDLFHGGVIVSSCKDMVGSGPLWLKNRRCWIRLVDLKPIK